MRGTKSSALVVDDERINLLIFNKMLAAFGVESANASNGYECVQLCSKRRFDYIFLDIMMPDMDGFETLREIKKMFEARQIDIPVICITGETDGNRRREIIAAGFADYMSKPINKKKLHDILTQYAPSGNEILSGEDEDSADEGEERLPEWIHLIKELDAEYGVMHCGSVQDYLTALKIFKDSIDERAKTIDKYIKQGDLDSLKLMVHSLKSTSLAVGAKQLSEVAKLLEKSCEDNNISLIYTLTPEFLNQYRRIGAQLKKYWDGDGGEESSKNITDRDLKDAYDTIRELMKKYDLGSIDNLLKSLNDYDMPDKWRELFDSLNVYIRKMDWEAARKLLDDFTF